MTPILLDTLPRDRGDGEIWDVGGGSRLLLLPEGDTAHVSVYRPRDRAEGERLTRELEAVARRVGIFLEASPGIDVVMIVVRKADAAALLQAFADQLGPA